MNPRSLAGLATLLAACSSGPEDLAANVHRGRGFGAPCDSMAECGGRTPLCVEGTCVECTDEMPCEDGLVCSRGRLCVECADDEGCPTDRPFCRVEEGRCVTCRAASDCDEEGTACDEEGRCVEPCSEGSCGENEVCHVTRSFCASCVNDAQCTGETPFCADGFRCVECYRAAHCPSERPHCVGGTCRSCIQDLNCPDGERCTESLTCAAGA